MGKCNKNTGNKTVISLLSPVVVKMIFCVRKYFFLNLVLLFSRGVSDVGFPIFADTDADFAF